MRPFKRTVAILSLTWKLSEIECYLSALSHHYLLPVVLLILLREALGTAVPEHPWQWVSFSRSGFKLFALLFKSNSPFLFHISGCRESIMGISRVCPAFPAVLLPTSSTFLEKFSAWDEAEVASLHPNSLIFSSWNQVFRHQYSCSALLPWNDPVLPLWILELLLELKPCRISQKALESTRDFLANYWVCFIGPGLLSLNEEFVPFKISQFTTIPYWLKISS